MMQKFIFLSIIALNLSEEEKVKKALKDKIKQEHIAALQKEGIFYHLR